jgi:hypothetical protein
MQEFAAKYGDKIQGVLSGFDRLIFRGTLRRIAYECGMQAYLWANRILLKDFGPHAQEVSECKDRGTTMRRGSRKALRCSLSKVNYFASIYYWQPKQSCTTASYYVTITA